MQSTRPAGVPPRLRVSLAAAQLAVIAGMLWWSFTWESEFSDTVAYDTEFIAFVIAVPLTLAASYGAGRSLQKRSSQTEPRVTRHFARIAQGATLVLLVPTLLTFPLALLGEIFFPD